MTKTFEEEAKEKILNSSRLYIAHEGAHADVDKGGGMALKIMDVVYVFPWLEFARNWHSDEEFQELFDKFSNLNDNYEKEVIRSSKLEEQNIGLKFQLQQQALPVVPEFVGDYISGMKENGENIAFAIMCNIYNVAGEGNAKAIHWKDSNPEDFARAWLDGYTVEKSDKCMVKLGALYFKCWNDVDAVFIIDDQPGAYESAFVFKKREDAEKVAQLVGGRVVKN